MLLWRLSSQPYAAAFDGGYGLRFDGRWNTVGHAVTYCATSPSLCVLEKLVHVDDPALLPALAMVTYDAPNDLGIATITLADLQADWRQREGVTQTLGDTWHRERAAALLIVPSVIVPLADSPDLNVVINHAHPDVAAIHLRAIMPYVFDPRLI